MRSESFAACKWLGPLWSLWNVSKVVRKIFHAGRWLSYHLVTTRMRPDASTVFFTRASPVLPEQATYQNDMTLRENTHVMACSEYYAYLLCLVCSTATPLSHQSTPRQGFAKLLNIQRSSKARDVWQSSPNPQVQTRGTAIGIVQWMHSHEACFVGRCPNKFSVKIKLRIYTLKGILVYPDSIWRRFPHTV